MGNKILVWLLFMCGLVSLLHPGRILANTDQATPIPSQLSLSPIAKGFQINWEPGSDDAVIYKIFWSNADTVSEADHVGVLTTSATVYEHTGLVPGRTYYYRIMACSCDCSPLSNVTSAVYQPTSAEVHTLSGNVTVNGSAIRPSADPMVTATVRATEITGANLGNYANVTADGSYQMALFPGTYNISVDYWFAETSNGTSTNFGSWGHPGPQSLLVSADTSRSIDIALHVLTGVIKDTSGNPVPNVAVVYSHGSTTTSSEGTYTLYFLQGTYGLEIKPPAGTRFVPATVEVSIPGTAPSIALQKQPILSGSVTVNGSPIQSGADPAVSATVRATEVTGANQGNSATVNPDGTYQLALAPGTYNIAVNYWLGESWHGTWINFASWSHPGPQNLKFSADMTTNIDLPLHALTGTVKDANGNPLSNVDISYSNGSTTTSEAPGFEGTYKLYFLQGTYTLEVRPPAATRYVATSVEVSVPGNAPSIQLQKQALLSGSITVNGSILPPKMMDSMAGATVRATEINGANQGNTVEVDSDGTYRMALSPGNYNISVDYWFGEDWHGTSINYGSWGYPGASNLAVTTDISQDIDIPLHVLSGTVKDIGGNPVSDVQLNYSGPYSNGTIKTSAEAGFEGTYKLYFLPGTYSVQVNAPPALFPPSKLKG